MANICTARVFFYGNKNELRDLSQKLHSAGGNGGEIYIDDLKKVFKLSDKCDHRTTFMDSGYLTENNGLNCLKTSMRFAWGVDVCFLTDLVQNYSDIKYVYQAEETDNGIYCTNDYKQLFFDDTRYVYSEDRKPHFDIELAYSTKFGAGNRIVFENHEDHYFPLYSEAVFENKNVDNIISDIVNAKGIPELCIAIKRIFDKTNTDGTSNYIDEVLNFYDYSVKGKTDNQIKQDRKLYEANRIAKQINSFFGSLESLDEDDEIENVFIIRILENDESEEINCDKKLFELGKKLHEDFADVCSREDVERFCDYLNSANISDSVRNLKNGNIKGIAKDFVTCPVGYAWINDVEQAKKLANRLIQKRPFSKDEYYLYASASRFEALNIVIPVKKVFEEAYYLLDYPLLYEEYRSEDYVWMNSKFDTSSCEWRLPETAYRFAFLEYGIPKITLETLQKMGLYFASKDEIVIKNKKIVFEGTYSHGAKNMYPGWIFIFDAVWLAGGETRQSVSGRSDYFVFGECMYSQSRLDRIVLESKRGHIIPIVMEDDFMEALRDNLPQDIVLEDVLAGKYHDEVIRKKNEIYQRQEEQKKAAEEEKMRRAEERIRKREERMKAFLLDEENKKRLKEEKEAKKKTIQEAKEQQKQEIEKRRQEKKELQKQLKLEQEQIRQKECEEERQKKETLLKNAVKLPYPDNKIKERTEKLFSKLEEFYPEHKAFAMDALLGDKSETLGILYKTIGYASRDEMLAAYGYEIISRDEVKELRNKVIYTPGNEPEIIRSRVENTILKLEEYYPDHKITGAIQNEHKSISSTISGLYQWLGYNTASDMLEAYGFTYDINNSGGRPSTDYDKIINDLKEKYKDAPFEGTLQQLAEENPEFDAHCKIMNNRAPRLYGMTLKKYLQKQMIMK